MRKRLGNAMTGEIATPPTSPKSTMFWIVDGKAVFIVHDFLATATYGIFVHYPTCVFCSHNGCVSLLPCIDVLPIFLGTSLSVLLFLVWKKMNVHA